MVAVGALGAVDLGVGARGWAMVSERERIEEELRREEARLADLSREQEQIRARVEQLRQKLADSRGSSSSDQIRQREPLAGPSTPAEKITLFRSLFRGRADVFPRLWINSRSGKRGYSPACANEWVRGICDKPKVKCGECPNQAFVSVDDQVIRDHLQGRHVVGVYPLLEDETCWFLAVDFDKSEWQEDVAAFVETCSRLELPVAVERSRSGNGGARVVLLRWASARGHGKAGRQPRHHGDNGAAPRAGAGIVRSVVS